MPDVNSRMASALDMLISLSRSGGDDGIRDDDDDDDCGGGVGGDGNDSSGELTLGQLW